MNKLYFILAIWVCATRAIGNGSASTDNTNVNHARVMIAIGSAGETEFGKEFAHWGQLWEQACSNAVTQPFIVGLAPTNTTSDLENLKQALALESTNTTAELWLVLIGHGTFDGQEAKFNLRGPDLSATMLAEWLKPLRRPVIIINCASASSPFLNKLSAPNRIIVTATRSGSEENYARFGKYMAETIAHPAADLDKDDQTSLLEAFIMASRRVMEFYDSEGRLATEHALLDDNGDGLGTPADFFRGARAVKKPSGGVSVDGVRAHQIHLVRSPAEQQLAPETRIRRDEIETALAKLRDSKAQLGEADYYQRLENLLQELARLCER